ncbi:uncharacterized protein SPSK_03563 [Sporothrix schenckii 1099-18]|uniref:Luciferase domain-containing protein n=1 Tax=Sporothrix schenckii 1099-18 TaxID=1397361 RepID=A0A0F2LX57_SPOSC|nr:uncharacterized protein SPSK_03563 [Sporothrix schenckii 1099-18]KJR82043.1 hypothetical protein SPSK_03563 [Sporothrix schenckii 1099-18]
MATSSMSSPSVTATTRPTTGRAGTSNSLSSSYSSDDSFLHRTNSALDDDNDRHDDDNLASNFYSVPHNLTSFLDHRPLAWRMGLPLAHDLTQARDLKDSSLHYAPSLPQSPRSHSHSHSHSRGRRPREDTLDRLRYDMADFVKATVWANHDTVRLRPSACAKHTGEDSPPSKGIFVDCGLDLPRWLLPTRGEHLHLHADGSAHMILSRADATAAVQCGWAERLPVLQDLVDGGSGGHEAVQYVAVHAPRSAAELPDWKRLVLASVRFCTYTQRELSIRRPERL